MEKFRRYNLYSRGAVSRGGGGGGSRRKESVCVTLIDVHEAVVRRDSHCGCHSSSEYNFVEISLK